MVDRVLPFLNWPRGQLGTGFVPSDQRRFKAVGPEWIKGVGGPTGFEPAGEPSAKPLAWNAPAP
jgi:hypothetical protein